MSPVRAHHVGSPDKHGALGEEDAARLLEDLRSPGPVVLAAHPSSPTFSSGMDMEFIRRAPVRAMTAMFDILESIVDRDDLVVSAVTGKAVGGGWIVAAFCDVCVAAHDAVFLMPEMRSGVPPFLGVAALEARLSREDLIAAAFACEPIGAEKLATSGVLSVTKGDAVEEAHLIARSLADGSPRPRGALKAFMRREDRQRLAEGRSASASFFEQHLSKTDTNP